MDALQRAVRFCGSQAELARRIGRKSAHIWNWLNRDKKVPAEAVLLIESATDFTVTRHELRPDLYPDPVMPREAGITAGRDLCALDPDATGVIP